MLRVLRGADWSWRLENANIVLRQVFVGDELGAYEPVAVEVHGLMGDDDDENDDDLLVDAFGPDAFDENALEDPYHFEHGHTLPEYVQFDDDEYEDQDSEEYDVAAADDELAFGTDDDDDEDSDDAGDGDTDNVIDVDTDARPRCANDAPSSSRDSSSTSDDRDCDRDSDAESDGDGNDADRDSSHALPSHARDTSLLLHEYERERARWQRTCASMVAEAVDNGDQGHGTPFTNANSRALTPIPTFDALADAEEHIDAILDAAESVAK